MRLRRWPENDRPRAVGRLLNDDLLGLDVDEDVDVLLASFVKRKDLSICLPAVQRFRPQRMHSRIPLRRWKAPPAAPRHQTQPGSPEPGFQSPELRARPIGPCLVVDSPCQMLHRPACLSATACSFYLYIETLGRQQLEIIPRLQISHSRRLRDSPLACTNP